MPNFLIRITADKISEFFESIDYIKEQILNAESEEESQYYQALQGQYENELSNIVIERG